MELQKKAEEIQRQLKQAGYSDLSEILEVCMNRNDVFKIGVTGDYSTGKSSVINALLGKNILSTSIIPNENVIKIRHGLKEGIVTEDGEIQPLDYLDSYAEKSDEIIIECREDVVSGKEFVEFPGLISMKKISNIHMMKELYLCDAVILTFSAEHMLSETECFFIENYSKFADEKQLLVVINKLDLIEKGDRNRVVEFVSKQMEQRFPNINWCFLQKELIQEKKGILAGIDAVKQVIKDWRAGNSKSINDKALANIERYIKTELVAELKQLKKESLECAEEKKILSEKAMQKKQLERARLENLLLDFEVNKNHTLNQIDDYLKDAFEKAEKSVLQKFDASNNKYEWYKNQLPKVWEQDLKIVAQQADKFILNLLKSDIAWLNRKSLVHTDARIDIMGGFQEQVEISYQGKPYGKVKKYISLGIGGSVTVGFCLFRIVGAAVGLAGGVLFGYCVNYLDKIQCDEIRKSVSVDINKIASTSRKMTEEEISKTYDKIVLEYRRNIDKYISKQYHTKLETKDYEVKIAAIEKIMDLF